MADTTTVATATTTTTTATKRTIYARCPRCANRRRVVVHSDGEARAVRQSRCKGCGGGKPVGAVAKVKVVGESQAAVASHEVGHGVQR